MADYLVVGKKGTGKSKLVVSKIHDYLSAGKRVATNIDIDLVAMCAPMSRMTLIRLPDKPMAEDLEMIGVGNDQIDEELNGMLALDEAGTWLNARTFADKSRSGFLDFCVHSRKYGWDMWLMCQNIGQVDRQMREALVEYVIRCMRLDKMKIPIIGGFLHAITFGKLGKMKVHYASTRLMESPDIKIDGEFYKGTVYQSCYNTRQRFREWIRDPKDPGYLKEIYVGPYSVLSAWHLHGRHMTDQPKPNIIVQILQALFAPQPRRRPAPMPQHPLVAKISQLPPDERIRHFKRLQAAGAL